MSRNVHFVERARRVAMLSDTLVMFGPIGSARRRMLRAEADRAHRVLDVARALDASDRARAAGVREPARRFGRAV